MPNLTHELSNIYIYIYIYSSLGSVVTSVLACHQETPGSIPAEPDKICVYSFHGLSCYSSDHLNSSPSTANNRSCNLGSQQNSGFYLEAVPHDKIHELLVIKTK